ncbi:AAA family ATPase [Catellatospora citrea]|uniref:Helix-turn-helix transcriptional regulator n=1 Tax=Catellatospora citrea TaxID=53366 RepID=A0A8J3NYQ9_9ACTN|nr:LuxR family transcriptional regulator [Catellatospora citrea]RKE05646.1 regulatory LuxR family protein [Catellatospora citrea]GIF97001.1 helix-turn-helix transcriptional regulator [Catellatospora citrea]
MTAGRALYGRRAECEVLDRLLSEVKQGRGATVVLCGESGVGKTALLDYLAEKASALRTYRVSGVESEIELAYASLQQLCAPMLDRLDRLPEPQRDALRGAFGLDERAPPDRLLVGLATLTLLSEVAADRPLLCLVDDFQWLDRASAQALAFAARRLVADPIGLVFAVRLHDDGYQQNDSEYRPGEIELAGLPELVVGGLGDRDARSLLASVAPGPLDERVRDRILAEARGNPLALLELPGEPTPPELAGGYDLPGSRPPISRTSRIERGYLRRVDGLAPQTRQLLLVAAAEPLGDPALLRRAASGLALPADAAAPAEAAGLITVGTRVRFAHPLVRSAVYRSAAPAQRRQAHLALAEATDRLTDPDRRAWHLAAATAVPEESVAQDLEHSAQRAKSRGGAAAAAAFLQRAAELTPDLRRRGERALAAAQAAGEAGAPAAANDLLAMAQLSPLDRLQQARCERLRAQLVFYRSRGSDAPDLLLQAAQRLAPLDAAMARETYLEALLAAMCTGAGQPEPEVGVRAVAAAARTVPVEPGSQQAADLLLDGLSTQFTQGFPQAVPTLRRALEVAGAGHTGLTLVCLACSLVAMELWEDTAWLNLLEREVRVARQTGTLSMLPVALDYLASYHIQAGDFTAAAAFNDESVTLDAAIRVSPPPYSPLMLAAWRGDQQTTAQLTRFGIQDASPRGEGSALVLTEYAAAVLDNGLGHYSSALAAAERAITGDVLVARSWTLTELVEAAARDGRRDVGEQALEQLAERTQASGTQWALGSEARSRALLSEGPPAEDLYREAIDRFGHCRMNAHLARAHLVYGEWLRRENRRQDAREHLHRAHDMLTAMGAAAFGERARNELLATGEAVRKRSADTVSDLTPQEALIASLARDGRTNHEIGAELFLSPRTVEWHLRKVFTKLAINSRRDLREAALDTKLNGAR